MIRYVQIVVLILAGEMIFGLPFHTSRFFRPTFLDVFGISNTNLGDIFAIYGITAMLAYFPGGVIADKFAPRKLLTVSLVLTALGGLYMATIPAAVNLGILFGYWGVTTILLFWAAMLKATRQWGGDLSQGRAFGILDGGRGLVAAMFASVAVIFMASFMPDNLDLMTAEEQRAAFRNVILLYSATTASVGLLTWFLVPDGPAGAPSSHRSASFKSAVSVLGKPIVWGKAGIIIFAYCGYKGLDNLSLYAAQVLGMNEVDAANLAANAGQLRLFGAVTAGIIADRFIASRTIGLTFIILAVSFGILSVAGSEPAWRMIIFANIAISAFSVYAIRGIYFALLQETGTPPKLTGTTIGIMSFLGYTPEIFFASIAGRILDASPGVEGHQNYFLFLAGLSVLGLGAVWSVVRINRRRAPGMADQPA